MKKIYLISPLIVLLIIILIAACSVMRMPDGTADVDNVAPGPISELALSNEPDVQAILPSAPTIDMSVYMQNVGLPTPHGSAYDDVQPLEFTKSDVGVSIEFQIDTVSFLAVGDNLIHSSIYADAKDAAGGIGYTFDHMYENLAEQLKCADLSFINQESPIAGDEYPPSGYPMFNTPSQMGDTLLSLGFDIISIANNHMLDKYENGLKNHIKYWSDKPVTLIGGYMNEEDFNNIRVVEKNGISIALLSYTYGTNGMSLPTGSEMVIPLIDDQTIVRQIKSAKQKADLVFVSIHWGDENAFSPNSRQRELAKLMADNCVDVVLGHHSHTVQPIEWYERPDGKKMLVAFSLSNFMSGQEYSQNMLAGILTFDIEKINGAATNITNVLFTPTVTHYNNSWRGFKLYYLKDYTQELYSTARCSRFEPNVSYYTNKIKSVIAPEFLPDYLK